MSWKTVSLGEVCDFQNGFAFKSNLFTDEGLPILRISNIQNQIIDTNNLAYFKIESYKEKLEKYIVEPNDLLIAMSGGTTGKIGFNNTNQRFYLNQRVGNLKPKQNLNKKYLYYFLSTQVEKNLSISAGAAQPNLSTEQIKEMLLPFPSITTQQKIVEKLDTIFAEIERATVATEANVKNAEALFQSHLTEVFGQFNKGSYVTFGSVCDFVRGPFGGSLKKSYFVDSGYAVYEQQHAIHNQFVDIRYFIDENKFNEMKRFELKSGDLIMSCSGTMGKVAIAPVNLQKGVINQALLKLTPKKDVDAEFLKRLLTSAYFQNKLTEMAGGAAIQNVASVSLLKQIMIPMPSFDRQHEISKTISNFELNLNQLIGDYKNKKDSLSKLKQSVLQQAFNGDLVKE